MQLYRLCRQRYAELSGFGAKKTGGRWNRKGIAAVYATENAPLAVVEVLVHLDKAELPEGYVLLEISVPEIAILFIGNRDDERLKSFYQDGHLQLGAGFVGFSVPSVVVPKDRIVVLYPEADVSRNALAITDMSPFTFDPRLFLPPIRSPRIGD